MNLVNNILLLKIDKIIYYFKNNEKNRYVFRYVPYPGGGEKWGANGVGDDLYSFGFDGTYLWTGN